MVARALEVTKVNSQTPNDEIRLQDYADASDVSGWARSSIVDSLNAGIVSGRSSTELAPKAFVTRAEVAAIVQRNRENRAGVPGYPFGKCTDSAACIRTDRG